MSVSPSMEYDKSIIFIDGDCLVCSSFVKFIHRRDKENSFLFSALQSDFASQHLGLKGHDLSRLDTLILLEAGQTYTKSDAVIRVISKLGIFWRIFKVFFILPSKFRDAMYDSFAVNRYLFGSKNSCDLPSPELEKKFIQ